MALATLEMVLMVLRMEFFPANPRPAVTREPPARPEYEGGHEVTRSTLLRDRPARGPSSGASLKRRSRGLPGTGLEETRTELRKTRAKERLMVFMMSTLLCVTARMTLPETVLQFIFIPKPHI